MHPVSSSLRFGDFVLADSSLRLIRRLSCQLSTETMANRPSHVKRPRCHSLWRRPPSLGNCCPCCTEYTGVRLMIRDAIFPHRSSADPRQIAAIVRTSLGLLATPWVDAGLPCALRSLRRASVAVSFQWPLRQLNDVATSRLTARRP